MSHLNLAKIIIISASILVGFSIQNCGKSSPTLATQDTGLDLSVTPRENREAEEAALWLSHELIAPEELYQTIKNDLEAIRQEYMDSIPQLEVEFNTLNWVVDLIIMKVTEDGWRRIQTGKFYELDSLNTLFSVTEMDTILRFSYPIVGLTFRGRLNPWRLAEFYEMLDEVVWASPEGRGYPSCCSLPSNMYPWQIENGMSYLFNKTYWECTPNCDTEFGFWYFRVIDQGIEYLGGWDNSLPAPNWWDEAKVAFQHYWSSYE